jgi:hypothetical protein
MTLQVCAAEPDDVPLAAAVLAAASPGHPWTRWTVDADEDTRRLTEPFRLDLGPA